MVVPLRDGRAANGPSVRTDDVVSRPAWERRAALRRVVTVVSDGTVMDADELRKAAGYRGRPK